MLKIFNDPEPVKKEWFFNGRSTGVNVTFNVLDTDSVSELITVDDPQTRQTANVKIACKAILEWEGIVDENEEPLALTEENIRKVFNKIPDFELWVCQMARNVTVTIVNEKKKD